MRLFRWSEFEVGASTGSYPYDGLLKGLRHSVLENCLGQCFRLQSSLSFLVDLPPLSLSALQIAACGVACSDSASDFNVSTTTTAAGMESLSSEFLALWCALGRDSIRL